MVGLVGPIKWSTQALFIKKPIGNISTITTSIMSYIWQKTWNKKLRKKEVVAKRDGIAVFVLYVQIKIGQIFTQSRKET